MSFGWLILQQSLQRPSVVLGKSSRPPSRIDQIVMYKLYKLGTSWQIWYYSTSTLVICCLVPADQGVSDPSYPKCPLDRHVIVSQQLVLAAFSRAVRKLDGGPFVPLLESRFENKQVHLVFVPKQACLYLWVNCVLYLEGAPDQIGDIILLLQHRFVVASYR